MTPPESVDAIPDEEVKAACRAYRDAYPDGTSRAGQQGMRAALMADRTRNAPDAGGTAQPVAWRPIETAPKDGTGVLVYLPDFCRVREAWFCEETGLWPADDPYDEDGEPCNVGLPTHWMPLPAAPGSAPPTPAASPACGGEEAEAMAWACDQWPAWLSEIVEKTNAVSDRLDMSAEQAIAYGALITSPEQGEVVREGLEVAVHFMRNCGANIEDSYPEVAAAIAKIGGGK